MCNPGNIEFDLAVPVELSVGGRQTVDGGVLCFGNDVRRFRGLLNGAGAIQRVVSLCSSSKHDRRLTIWRRSQKFLWRVLELPFFRKLHEEIEVRMEKGLSLNDPIRCSLTDDQSI